MRGIEIFQRYAKPERVPVIAVVTKESIYCAGEIYEFFKRLKANVQLDIYDIRCMDLFPGNQIKSSESPG